MKLRNIAVVGVLLLTVVVLLTQKSSTSGSPFINLEGQGIISLKAGEQTVEYSSQRLSLYWQSLLGLPTVSFLTTIQPFNVPLLWWIVLAALLIANIFFVRTNYRDVEEITWVDTINDSYIYISIALVVVLMFLGTQQADYQFALFYTAMLIAAVVLIEKLIEKTEWMQDFKLGLSTDNGIFMFFGASPLTKALTMIMGVAVIGVFMYFGELYISHPTYASMGTFADSVSRLIPVIPEDLLLFRVMPLLMVGIITMGEVKLWGILKERNSSLSIREARDQHPRFFITSFIVALVITVSFTGLVIWPSYHQATYGRQAEWYATSCPAQAQCPESCTFGCGLTAEQVKAPMIDSVSNFGIVGAAVTIGTGSSIPVDIYHAIHNWGS